MKKNVYFVQVSAVYGNTVYLPYASGCLAAYAWQNDGIKSNYELKRFIYTKEDIDMAVASLEQPYLIGFSTYVWNTEYNKLFAKKVKEKYPDVIIVFGGHNVRPDGSDLLTVPEADIIMHGEGEISFARLLTVLNEKGDLGEVGNISFRRGGGIVTTPSEPAAEISDFPSPYLEGYFDDILKNEEISHSVIWETNRGCPNRCAFCDWGLLRSKVRLFPMERIEAEIRWMTEHKIEFVYCADANFGLFPRDNRIADMVVEANKKTGYPKVFRSNYAKNKEDAVFEINHKFISNDLGKSSVLSFQSLSGQVLENIGRSNRPLGHFKNLIARYSQANVPVYSELILGLPGETYDSFTDGISKLLECNQHSAIGIYPCELLPNSVMGTEEYRRQYGIRTVRTEFLQYHSVQGESSVQEYTDVVIATDSMTEADWKKSYIFSVIVQALHNLALTRAFAIYFHMEKGISYKTFYEGLIGLFEALPPSSAAGEVFRTVKELTDGVVTGCNSFSFPYGEKEILLWPFEEYMYIALAKNKERFYEEIKEYIAGFGADPHVTRELMKYQSFIIKEPGVPEVQAQFDYDFYHYFRNIYTDRYAPLAKVKNSLYIADDPPADWDELARYNVWYGRRNNCQIYTGGRNTVTYSEPG